MPPQYTTASVSSVSTAPNVPVAKRRVIHGAIAQLAPVSQANVVLKGRDRHPLFQTSKSAAAISASGFVKRHSACSMGARTDALARYLTTIPAIAAPTGQLFLGGKQLKESRLPKGASHYLTFIVTGKRLLNLQVRFQLRDLTGKALLGKTVLVAPGGVAIDEILTSSEGLQTITGYVLLMPHETQLSELPNEVELNYLLSIGNGSTREHLLESEYLSFYKA